MNKEPPHGLFWKFWAAKQIAKKYDLQRQDLEQRLAQRLPRTKATTDPHKNATTQQSGGKV